MTLRCDETAKTTSPRSFRGGYAVAIVGSALFVGFVHNLIWLDIVVQVASAVLLPIVIVLLIRLAGRPFVGEHRLCGREHVLAAGCSGAAAMAGLFGIVSYVAG